MERIHVSVRARPLSLEESRTSPWTISGNSIYTTNSSSKFEFDRIFGEDCKTAEVYKARTREIVASAVCGFNGTVFAYGQTNSGKTHTMRGSATEPGVIPMAVRDLFDTIHEDVDREFLLRMSYMEIYNEEINDLLAPEHRKLQIHENIEKGIFVAGLREEIVASPEQVLDLMEFGESHRHIGETNMNLYSSRSHTIFRMIIESRDKSEDEDFGSSCDAVRVSVLNLVDLAGSERAAKTGAEGVRLKEGSHINKSLMTLGTVIKKLSEGAESQGGHVPYRDSKLTRILQPALGGNSNTAIICNITLTQIHADETKSSLQFASRALRVTNCAHVNEILTDAALLKRQKKEIEELRGKLQGSHSEHLGEEILNLRNTLLQTELERERIALELEEEKKAQAEREKRLQEQAKKIENLSTMVLYSNRDDNCDPFKKLQKKRRDTWCPGKLPRETLKEASSTIQSKSSAVKPTRTKRDMGPLLPFEELVNETEIDIEYSCKQEDEDKENNALEDCTLPEPCALLNITNRRKLPLRKKSLPVEDYKAVDMQAEYEDLFLKFETQRTMSEIQMDSLQRKLDEFILCRDVKYANYSTCHLNKTVIQGDTHISLRESEAILVIKQLQERIKMLEMEKFSSQQNLDNIVELATEQNICAREKFEELYEELLNAREEARVACTYFTSNESLKKTDEGDFDSVIKLSVEVQETMEEVENLKKVAESVSSLVSEAHESFSAISRTFSDFKAFTHQGSLQQVSIISNHERLHFYMKQKVTELENEKLLLYNKSVDLQKQIEELRLDAQNSLNVLSEEQEMERSDLLSQILALKKEISCLSSHALVKEKEDLRKKLEKTKTKLREAECKLKNALQEKTKLEGDKAVAEREIKRLHGQRTLLERDINKRDSVSGRRRDSVMDRSSKVFDAKITKGLALEQTMQEDYRKLEVLAFEMEATIASLEDELAAAGREKEEAKTRSENLDVELEALSEKLIVSSSELNALQNEVSGLRLRLEDSNAHQQKMERSIKMLEEEKEELAMQLTDSLLDMEEEKAIWSTKEKASIEAIEEKANLYNAEIMALSRDMLEVRNELESCREECKVLKERLTCSEEKVKYEKKCSLEKSVDIDQLRNELRIADVECGTLKSNMEMLSLEHHHYCEKVNTLQKELTFLKKENEDLLVQIRESNTASELSNDFQDLKIQLSIITKERDKLITEIKKQQSHVHEVDFIKRSCNERLSESKRQIDELKKRLFNLEVQMHNDEVNNSKDKAKLRMRLKGTQAKLDAFRYRYKEASDELDLMNEKYKEASGKLKAKLASYGIEVLNLKKQLAAAKGL